MTIYIIAMAMPLIIPTSYSLVSHRVSITYAVIYNCLKKHVEPVRIIVRNQIPLNL